MKLLDTFKSIRKQEPKKPPELFLTLVVDSDHVAGACWYAGDARTAHLKYAVARKISVDSWEERTSAADEVITALEERSQTENIHKVIFGFSASYLNENGNIDKQVRSHLKTFTEDLELTPIGFVPVHQAIVYKLKKEDGVPATAILIGVYKRELTIALYKVGVLSGFQTIPNSSDRIANIEAVLKSFADVEVLPSRILLFGSDTAILEEFRAEMISYPWPTRANFLHFPKIVILPPDTMVLSVSVAGSSEITPNIVDKYDQIPQGDTPIPQESVIEEKVPQEEVSQEVPVAIPEDEEDEIEKENVTEEPPNIRFVAPEEIGFQKNVDVIQKSQYPKEEEQIEEKPASKRVSLPSMPRVAFSAAPVMSFLSSIKRMVPNKMPPIKVSLLPLLIIVGIVCVGILWLVFSVLPHASVVVTITPKQIEATASATIDPTAKTADPKTLVIPGEKLEKTVSGDKTVKVTGKKSVGDPAKGTVTIYNKTLDQLTLKKGAVLIKDSLKFTLDSEVQIASATETIGSITFGKGTGTVTASQIGTQSNLSAGSGFSFKDVSESVAIANNDQPFAGGTSREITVVSRADYDALVAAITPDLVAKAKQDLAAGVVGSKKLIEQTIKTTVTDKKFTEELDQETTDLHGTVTMNVTGIAYDDQVVQDMLYEQAKSTVPQGYDLVRDETTVTVGTPTVKKNGSIILGVTLSGNAKPFINATELKKMIAGKKVADALSEIKKLPGVSDVATTFSFAVLKSIFPKSGNITVTIKE